MSESERKPNRLIHETSPYLLQHAFNPVDWYPWGAEALETAKAQNKPILLSIGYAACHWCHVMAHESFENPDIAGVMNQHFINVKVDREERPDLDALYMEAVQALTGQGGWPMTVFLTPDGAPFYAGTYFPPEPRYGMPSFRTVLEAIADLYANRHDEVERQAQAFREHYREQARVGLGPTPLQVNLAPGQATIAKDVLVSAANKLVAQIDRVHGGLGGAPKFPHPMALEFLLRVESRVRSTKAAETGVATTPLPGVDSKVMERVRLTLARMAAGGIYDQIGGGFHRYATDAIWLVPHFEKMLYDNALLAPVYLHAWQLTGEAAYRRICEEILDYVLREMTGPDGGFFSTQDADSEGEEGKFYVWTPDELRAVLGEDDARVAELVWGVTPAGNFEGKNILHVERTPAQAAETLGMDEADVRAAMQRARTQLYEARSKRVWPGRDDKVLTAWNGWMLRAFAEAGRILDRDDYRAAAVKNADFLLEQMQVNGRLARSWRDGQAKLLAYLDDYAALVNGLLSIYEAAGDARYFPAARRYADELLGRFWEDAVGAFFDTASDAETLIGRPRELTDNATPSGTSLAAEALLRLSSFTADDRYREHAVRVLVPLAPAMAEHPSSFAHLLCALDDLIGPFYEVALVGEPGSSGLAALERALSSRFQPRMALAVGTGEQSAVPLLEGRTLLEGHAAAYVCQGFVCQQPVTSPEALLAEV
ncbi:MAG TPA: thioredoxin domain-containing protein [Ktedonobacterales bacterium]